jgi:hypothetical protein
MIIYSSMMIWFQGLRKSISFFHVNQNHRIQWPTTVFYTRSGTPNEIDLQSILDNFRDKSREESINYSVGTRLSRVQGGIQSEFQRLRTNSTSRSSLMARSCQILMIWNFWDDFRDNTPQTDGFTRSEQKFEACQGPTGYPTQNWELMGAIHGPGLTQSGFHQPKMTVKPNWAISSILRADWWYLRSMTHYSELRDGWSTYPSLQPAILKRIDGPGLTLSCNLCLRWIFWDDWWVVSFLRADWWYFPSTHHYSELRDG